MSQQMKELWKSVNIWQSHRKKYSGLFFLTHSVFYIQRNKYYKQRLEWRFGLWFWLWVKVFIRERELTFTFAICCRPFVCRLPVVCNVQSPYSAGWNFRQCFYTISYIGHPLTSTQYFTDIVPVEPLHRRVLRKRGSQNSYFGPVEGYISEMVQDMSSYDKLVLIINRKSYIWAFD